MNDYSISLGIVLEQDDLNRVKSQINKLELDPIKIQLDTSNVQKQINNIRNQIQNLSNIKINLTGTGFGGGAGAANAIKSEMSQITAQMQNVGAAASNAFARGFQGQAAQITTTANNAANTIRHMQNVLQKAKFNNSSIDLVTQDLKEMSLEIQNVTTRINGNNLNISVRGIDELGRAVTIVKQFDYQSGNITNVGKVIAQSFSTSADAAKRFKTEVNSAFSQMMSKQSKINSFRIKLAGVEESSTEAQALTATINRLQSEYNELHAVFGQHLSTKQMNALQSSVQLTIDKINALRAHLSDTKVELAAGIQANFGNYEAQIISLEGKFNSLAAQPDKVRTQIEELKAALRTMRSADTSDEIIAANKIYKNVLKSVETQLRLNAEAERQANNNVSLVQTKQNLSAKMSAWLRENSAATKQFGGEIKRLQVELNSVGNTDGVRRISKEFQNVTLRAKEAGVASLSFGDKIKRQFAQYSSYFSVYSLFMYGTMAMRSMFEQVKLIDSAMTELKKVTDETDASYERFLTNAATRAREIGTTIDGLVSSTADFARLGYGFKDAQGLAEVANIYAVVGDEVEGVEGATESLISTMAAFKDEMNGMSNSDFAMSIIDKFNEIGNNFAISSGGIGEAMERSASSLMAANNTIDESIALITAANTVVQDPAQVGTAFKTMSMRIRGAKTE